MEAVKKEVIFDETGTYKYSLLCKWSEVNERKLTIYLVISRKIRMNTAMIQLYQMHRTSAKVGIWSLRNRLFIQLSNRPCFVFTHAFKRRSCWNKNR